MFSHVSIFLLILAASCMYEGNSPVKLLNEETFPKMLKSKGMWMVEFYSPQCGHCVQAAPEYEKAATIAEGVISFGAVDMTKYPSLGSSYGIRGYPTFKFFGGNKDKPVDFSGQRSAQEFVQFGLSQTKDVITSRANGGKSSGSGKGGQKQPKGDKNSRVTEITDANFEKVLSSDEAWFIDFYSPNCGHCKTLEPEFQKLPEMMKGKVRIGKVDATVHRNSASKYDIKGYPTMIFFPKGKKTETINYEGQRTVQEMATWLNSQKIGSVKVQWLQLSRSTYNQECQRNNACVLFIVEDDKQLESLKPLRQVMQSYGQEPIRYLYTKEKLDTLQSDLMIDDRAYPKALSLLPSRNSYKMFNKPVSKQTLQQFLKSMFSSNWIKFSNKIEDYLFPNTEL